MCEEITNETAMTGLKAKRQPASQCGSKKYRVAGFTLLELLLTMAVVSILFAIAVPSMQSAMASYQLSGAVDSASWAIQATRYQAIMHGYPYRIAFDATQNTYQVSSEPPGAVAFANVGGPIPVSSSPITLSANTTLQFKGNGSVSATTGAMNFSISYKGNTKTLTVSNYGSISTQ